jgi:hypothetical protein
MPSITTQNIASVSSQVRPNESAVATSQEYSKNGSKLSNEAALASRAVGEAATVAPDGGAKSRATDSEKRVANTSESAARPDDNEENTRSKPSADGTGRRVNLVA